MKRLGYTLLYVICIYIILNIFIANKVEASSNLRLSYSTHVQNIGWQDFVPEEAESGTTGQGLRLEAIKINLNTAGFGGNIEYATHVQNIGWQNYVNSGEQSGTSGQSLRLEAIKIRVTGEFSNYYDIYYRVHIQNIGWQEWKKNGEEAGTTGLALRLEAIEIKMVKKDNASIIHGMDVSSYQKNINWDEVKKQGIQFAMLRVGYRGYGISSEGIDGRLVIDPYFHSNINEAIRLGIPVGVYFFSQAKNEEEAIEEANLVIDNIKNYKITYPVAIDVEYANSSHSGRADGLTKEERTKVIQAFCNTIKNAGYKAMLYTGRNFAINNLEMDKLSMYDLWLAHYTGASQDDPLKKPSNYTGNYTMWQYASSGSVSGIEGRVDMNICFKKYN